MGIECRRQNLNMKRSELFKIDSTAVAGGQKREMEDFCRVTIEDDICIGIVCDGVGGASAGGEGARRCMEYLETNFKAGPRSWSVEKSLSYFISSINSILYKEGIDHYGRPEYLTTLSIAIVHSDTLYIANVGDSPIWLYRDGKTRLLSRPHNPDRKGMEHILTKAVGMQPDIEPHFYKTDLEIGDIVLLASDGLEKISTPERIVSLIPLGAHAIVGNALSMADGDLPDDTSAVTIEIRGSDMKAKMRSAELPIPKTISAGDIVDGYRTISHMTKNDRVWLCEKGGKRYIMKFPPPEASDDIEVLDLFVKEAWNAQRLESPFFPKAHIPHDRSLRYYLMEYIEGEPLSEAIERGAVTIEDTIELAKFLIGALSYLLGYDLVHGDIKPENIIVTHENGERRFRLVDYGSIVEIFSITSRAGTPSFLSPERFTGAGISESSEIFAVGVTLYLSLTGRYPYGEIEPFQTPLFKSPTPPGRYNDAIPAWFESIVMRAIERDRERRYSLYSEMDYELSNPSKVLPYFPENATLLQREPVLVYRWAFTLSLLANIALILFCMG